MLLFMVVFLSILFVRRAEIQSGRFKGEDEPHIVSWRVLEGVTEPFDSFRPSEIPLWKQMKNSADQKAANMMIQAALSEYGQLLRHWHFAEMPMEERYDVFLSMSKLLKVMGFHQRAELLLFEAISYTTKPYEAHFQLGLLYLDKEDLEKAKVHLKNCLFFRDNDVIILSYLSVVLIAEGKLHEAKFFISRILSGLEARVSKLSALLNINENQSDESDRGRGGDGTAGVRGGVDVGEMTARVDFAALSRWTEDLFSKVFHGEFRITPSASMETMKMFSNLYSWLAAGEMTGRFVFDLGQALYEAGRPKIGHMMMQRGFETSDAAAEGVVSTEIVKMRLALDYPVVPSTILEIVEAYLNMTNYLAATARMYTSVDLENVMDIYWPLPLLWWSALPVMPVISEVMWRFEGGPERRDEASQLWLKPPEQRLGAQRTGENSDNDEDDAAADGQPADAAAGLTAKRQGLYYNGIASLTALWTGGDKLSGESSSSSSSSGTISSGSSSSTGSSGRSNSQRTEQGTTVNVRLTAARPVPIEVGIMGGHMNNHAAGQMVLHRILGIADALERQGKGRGRGNSQAAAEGVRITLIALPLVPDSTTKKIAGKVFRIVNLPVDTAAAWRVIEGLHLDVLLFPDYQPFPDQQSVLFQSRRIAPVQMCFFVRGSSCATADVDYYLLPAEVQDAYLAAATAADSTAVVAVAAPATTTETTTDGHPSGGKKQLRVRLRPPWLESFSEQVVVLDWPLLLPQVVQNIARSVVQEEAAALNRKPPDSAKSSPSRGPGAGSSGAGSSAFGGGNSGGSDGGHPNDPTAAAQQGQGFAPSEVEGQIFFEGQPVAVIPLVPMYMHPLMDEVIFKIMRAVPLMQVVLVLPDSFFSHVQDPRHKMNWARKVARRLWSRGGDLYHRIRLLPSPLSDARLLQFLRLADVVLDTFPVGSPLHLHALSLSVGTPVVTLKSGSVLSTPREDLQEMRVHLQLLLHSQMLQRRGANNSPTADASVPDGASAPVPAVGAAAGFKRRLDLNPMFRRIALGGDDGTGMGTSRSAGLDGFGAGTHAGPAGTNAGAAAIAAAFDVPWAPAVNVIEGYYRRMGVDGMLVANGTAEYFGIVSALLTDREAAYLLRVRLLEAVDGVTSSATSSSASSAGTTTSLHDVAGDGLNDLASFIEKTGRPWADLRNQYHAQSHSQRQADNGDRSNPESGRGK